jgi:hypothetical protein
MSLQARPLAALTLTAAFALGACGNEKSGGDRLSAEAYRTRLAAVERQVEKAYPNLERGLKAATVSGIRAGLTPFAAAQQRAAETLAELQPPKNAERANKQLAHGADRLANEVRATVAKLKTTTDPNQARKLVSSRLDNASGPRELDQALGKLNKLGYTTSGDGQ